jgi:hypothetical protein
MGRGKTEDMSGKKENIFEKSHREQREQQATDAKRSSPKSVKPADAGAQLTGSGMLKRAAAALRGRGESIRKASEE